MTADTGFRLLFMSMIWLFGLACMVGYVIIGATMQTPTFRAVLVLAFGSVMTIATVIFFTIVFFVRRKAT